MAYRFRKKNKPPTVDLLRDGICAL